MAMLLKTSLVIAASLCLSSAKSLGGSELADGGRETDILNENEGYKNPLDGKYFEGDLKISQDIIDYNYGNKAQTETLTLSPCNRWPENIVYYFMEDTVSKELETNINHAIRNIENNVPCVRLIRTLDTQGYSSYLTFSSNANEGCYATTVGYCMGKVHQINLESPQCDAIPTILHELGHILGMWHEQSRADRDKYVAVHMENVEKGQAKQFDIRTGTGVSVNQQIYDYASIMHSSEYAHSKNGQKTITVSNVYEYKKAGEPVLGGGKRLSLRDIATLKRYYGCPD